ncbi:hypothetical protein [uncultured Methylobacterium sp.]|uniref:hypothetical protein n=1 Tax=uncultured Methylobacterium sp. TaxID=157278 RepID=UPI00259173D5|nr:hypothetical protein [uncultured Methylobacterium sp.]
MTKTKATKQNPANTIGAEWLVKNRDLNWEVEGAFYTELEARIWCEEWNSHPEVNREQMKVFGPGA